MKTYNFKTHFALGVFLVCFLCAQAASGLELAPILSDGVVFQRGMPIRVWGTANPGESIVGELSGNKAKATASANGRWFLEFPAYESLKGDLVIRSAAGQIRTIKQPLLGQVWLCGGQSNMAMTLMNTDGATQGESLPDSLPTIQLFLANHHKPQMPVNQWVKADSGTAPYYSAICFMVGRMLAERLNEPVGLVDVSVGGTRVEAWGPDDQSATQPGFHFDHNLRNEPHYAFENVTRSVVPFNFKGLLWYQGEDNRPNASEYAHLFSQTMQAWRKSFQHPELPVVYVQLPDFTGAPSQSEWHEIQHQQELAQNILPNSRMVNSAGLRYPILHYKEKSEMARRAFDQVMKLAY